MWLVMFRMATSVGSRRIQEYVYTIKALTFVDHLTEYRKLFIDLTDTPVEFLGYFNREPRTSFGCFPNSSFDRP
jgi:hypothetical protein